RRNEGTVTGYLANLHFDRNRLDEACSLFETALAIPREVGARQQEGVTLGSLGRVLQRQGRMEAAREALTAGEAILREVKAVPDLAKLLCIRAQFELRNENAADARTILAEAESLAIQCGTGP